MTRRLPTISIRYADGSLDVYEDCDMFTVDPSDGVPQAGQAVVMIREDMIRRVCFGVKCVEVLRPGADYDDEGEQADADAATG